MKKVGILYDNISGNTGDVAIGLSVKKILRDMGVAFDELIPGNFNPLKYDTIVVGGGHILRPGPDFYYDKFKIQGAHILNAAGIAGNPADLQYLKDYEYVTVRSCGDKRKLSGVKSDVRVVPCTSMLLEDIKDLPISLKKPCIGIHLNPGSLSAEEEGRFAGWASALPYTVYFLPVTHYCQDYAYMERLASAIHNSIMLPLLKPLEIFTLIGRFDQFISSSMHGAIFSYAHGVPFILCDSNEKMRFFMEDRGLERHMFKGFDGMKKAFEGIAGDPPDYSAKLSSDLRKLDDHIGRIKEILPPSGAGPESASASDLLAQEAHQIQNLQLQVLRLESHMEAVMYQNQRLTAHAKGLEQLLERTSSKSYGTWLRPVSNLAGVIHRMETWSNMIVCGGLRREKNATEPEWDHLAMEDYLAWIQANEPSGDELATMGESSRCFSYRPGIAVVMDGNAPEGMLRRAVETVRGQVYDNWELCVAFDSSTGAGTRRLLEKYASDDKRVKLKALSGPCGAARRMDQAISLSSGEYVCFMDGTDELAPFALYEIVRTLNQSPGLDYVYSDHDCLDGSNRRLKPHFKPEWSPDLLLSCWYTDHLEAYRKLVLGSAGYFRPGCEGSHGYDLTLRFTELLSPDRIGHIPKVLYHMRIHANHANEDVTIRSIGEALSRRGEQGSVSTGQWPGSYRVKRAIRGSPMVSIIIPTKNSAERLKRCVDSIRQKTTYKNYEIVLVDHDSAAGIDHLGVPGCTRIRYDGKFNFSRMNNMAAARARGEYLLFLNDDTEVIEPGWIQAMLEHAMRPEIGAVGCKLLYPDMSVQHAGLITGMNPDSVAGIAGHIFNRSPPYDHGYLGWIDVIKNYSAVTAAAMMINRGVFIRSGGFDENLPVGYNDVDLCLRLGARGLLVIYTPYAALLHHESSTINAMPQVRDDTHDVLYMIYKWGKALKRDPYYNPNLSLRSGACEINR